MCKIEIVCQPHIIIRKECVYRLYCNRDFYYKILREEKVIDPLNKNHNDTIPNFVLVRIDKAEYECLARIMEVNNYRFHLNHYLSEALDSIVEQIRLKYPEINSRIDLYTAFKNFKDGRSFLRTSPQEDA